MKRIVRITILALFLALLLTVLAIAGPAQAATQPQVQLISGTVYGSNDGQTVIIPGAYVTARVSAWDPLYNRTNPNTNILARSYSYANGRYTLYPARACYIGTWIEVSAVKDGYMSILRYGRVQAVYQTVNFRLPIDEGQFPPLPINW